MDMELLFKYGEMFEPVDNYLVTMLDDVEVDHEYSLWYGGDVVSIQNGKTKFYISAIGDVRAYFYNEENELVDWVKDKNNSGAFSDFAKPYFKNDADLQKAICDGIIELENNNWWECFMVHNGEWYDLMWCLDSDKISDAIDEVIDAIPEMISYYNL